VRNDIPQRVHLVGVGGAHMSAIAKILRTWGHDVSGSDLRPSAVTRRLEDMGIRVYEGHRAENIDDADLVVTTSAAAADNPEIQEAHRRSIPVLKRAEMVAHLMQGRTSIAVAGTHGKTTTTALITYMLVRAGLSPTFLVGGEMRDLETNAEAGGGRHIVVEADEFDRAFLHYTPDLAVVTNIEPDHLDIYGTFDALVEAFGQFMAAVPPEGCIIACADSPKVRELLATTPLRARTIQRYALDEAAEWSIEAVDPLPSGGHAFVVEAGSRPYGAFRIALPGLHNVANALAAIAAGAALGLPAEVMQEAVASFRGAVRRFEWVGEAAGVIVMDDYAHHPTEVRATIAAARERFPDRRLVLLFQPHTYTRTQYLLDAFRTCFQDADALFLLETYAAREEPGRGLTAADLAREVTWPPAEYVATFEQAADQVAAFLQSGDVFFTVGAGDVDRVGPMVLERLRRREGALP